MSSSELGLRWCLLGLSAEDTRRLEGMGTPELFTPPPPGAPPSPLPFDPLAVGSAPSSLLTMLLRRPGGGVTAPSLPSSSSSDLLLLRDILCMIAALTLRRRPFGVGGDEVSSPSALIASG